MKWRLEVLECISRGARCYSEIKMTMHRLFGESIPDPSLYEALKDLKNAGFVTEIGETYIITQDGQKALELAKQAKIEGIVKPKRGLDNLIGKSIQAHIFKTEREETTVITLNPEEDSGIVRDVGIVIRLPCSHNIPSDSPWPGEMTCSECGRNFTLEWNPFRCVCGESRDVTNYIDGDRFFCFRCGKIWEVKGTTIKPSSWPPVLFPQAVALAESIFPILSSRPIQLFRV